MVIQPTFRQLQMFQLLMKTRSLTETARLMRISQPAVSQALRELEAQLGLTLFVRGGGRIRPSDEAVLLLPDVERTMGQVGALVYRANELKDARAGQVSVAAVPVVATYIVPNAVVTFQTERPRAKLSLCSLTAPEIVQLVRQEQVDVGFVFAPVDEAAAGAEPLFETELACLLPAGHRLVSRSRVAAQDLADEVVIALAADVPPGLLLLEALNRQAEGFVGIETNSATAALELVKAGVGVAVVDPLPMLAHDSPGVVVRRFEPTVTITLVLMFSRHRPMPRIAVQFVRHVRKSLAGVAARLTAAGVPSSAI